MTNIQEVFDGFHTKTVDVICGLEKEHCENSKGYFFNSIQCFNVFLKQFDIKHRHRLGAGNYYYVFDKNFNYIEEDYKKVRDEMKNMLETQTPRDRDKAVEAFKAFNKEYNSLCKAIGFERDTSND